MTITNREKLLKTITPGATLTLGKMTYGNKDSTNVLTGRELLVTAVHDDHIEVLLGDPDPKEVRQRHPIRINVSEDSKISNLKDDSFDLEEVSTNAEGEQITSKYSYSIRAASPEVLRHQQAAEEAQAKLDSDRVTVPAQGPVATGGPSQGTEKTTGPAPKLGADVVTQDGTDPKGLETPTQKKAPANGNTGKGTMRK